MSDLTTDDFTPLSLYNITDVNDCMKMQKAQYDQFIQILPSLIQTNFTQDKVLTRNALTRRGANSVNSSYKAIHFGFSFTNIKFAKSHHRNANHEQVPKYPNECRADRNTYSIKMSLDINVYQYAFLNDGTQTAKQESKFTNVYIGDIPCMVGSKYCHLYGLDSTSLVAINENPDESGGYFIIDGSEKVLLCKKSVLKNAPQFYLQNKEGVIAQCTITCQHGDNFESSHYLVIKLYTNYSITIELTLGKDVKLILPFHILYKVFNMHNDRDIFGTILPNYDQNNDRHIQISVLFRKAMLYPYHKIRRDLNIDNHFNKYYNDDTLIDDPTELALILADIIDEINKGATAEKISGSKRNNEDKKNIIASLLGKLDAIIFPHIGITPELRIDKLKYLGSLINRLYGVALGDEQSDRNSFANQVINTASTTLIMSFKTLFNVTTVAKLVSEIINMYDSKMYPIDMKTIFGKNIHSEDLGTALCKAIKAGNKDTISINKKPTANRVLTNTNGRTNTTEELNGKRSLQNAKPMGGKSNAAVLNSRNNHPTSVGIIDQIQSVEGDRAGLTTAIAISCEFSDVIYSEDIMKLIMDNPEIESMNKIYSDDCPLYSLISFNGKPIGSHYNTKLLWRQYLQMRREGKIDRQTSIIYHPLNQGLLEIVTQKERPLRPFVIVYNNFDEYVQKGTPFKQYIKYTRKHAEQLARREISLLTLLDEGVIEYIAPIEYTNIIVADSYEAFMRESANPLRVFTHLDLPYSNYGVAITVCPFSNHSATVRTTYSGNHSKQTLGVPILNYGSDDTYFHKLYLCINSYEPIAQTIFNKIMRSNGATCMVAIMSGNNNQEDSLIVNESMVARGKYTIICYTTHTVELESGQYFGTPIIGVTQEIRASAYSHLVDGVPKKGTVIRKGMPLIGVLEKDSKDKTIIKDRSLIFKKLSPVIVDSVKSTNSKGHKMMIVKAHSIRTVESGDKFAARSGGKAIISSIVYEENMPITAGGLSPDAMLNPHAFPSRMIPNQIMESVVAKYAVHLGIIVDVSALKSLNPDQFKRLMGEVGIDFSGTEVFYDDKTGEKLKCKVFIAPTVYNRLSKMIKDNSSVVDKPTLDIRTQQRTKGINSDGGTRFGEMEKETTLAVGTILTMENKMFKDSDGKRAYICNTCGNIAYVNPVTVTYVCQSCPNTTFSNCQSTFATFGFLNINKIIGIGTTLKVAKTEFLA